MVGHGGSSGGSYLADSRSPIPSHCASIVATSTVRVNISAFIISNIVLSGLLLTHQNTCCVNQYLVTLPSSWLSLIASADVL